MTGGGEEEFVCSVGGRNLEGREGDTDFLRADGE